VTDYLDNRGEPCSEAAHLAASIGGYRLLHAIAEERWGDAAGLTTPANVYAALQLAITLIGDRTSATPTEYLSAMVRQAEYRLAGMS